MVFIPNDVEPHTTLLVNVSTIAGLLLQLPKKVFGTDEI